MNEATTPTSTSMTAPDDELERAAPSARAQRTAAFVRWLIIAFFALLAIAGILIGFDLPSRLADGAATGEGAAKYYCPMHPQIKSDRPGTCPICGMDLVPIPPKGATQPTSDTAPGAAAHAGDTPVAGRIEVQIDPVRLREIGVVSVLVRSATVRHDITAPAQIAVDEAALAVVDTRFAGWLTKLRVRTRGEHVRRGQLLASVRSPDLYQAEAELVAAKRAGAVLGGSGDALLAQARARLESLGAAPAEIERVLSDGQPRTEFPLTAPRKGVLVTQPALEGSYVTPGTPIFTIADLDRVWVLADVPEHEASRVAVGDEASIESPAAQGRTWTGRVTLLDPLIDPRTRTQRVRIEVRNAASALVPGGVAYAHFGVAPRKALIAPRDAVLTSAAESHVFVDLGGGRLVPRAVTLGQEEEGMVEILSGLREGERIASAAAFMIDAESQLRATAESGGSTGTMPGMPGVEGAETNDDEAMQDMQGMRGMKGM